MWYGIGAGSAQAAAGGGTAAAGGGAAGAGGAAIGGPIAVGVVVAYVILHEIIKARRNERQEKFKKMHSPLQVTNAANVLKSWLGENGEALDVVNSLTPEQQINMLKIPPIYSYMDTRITAVTEQIPESHYSRSKNTNIFNSPQQQLRRTKTGPILTTGKTNPNWAEDLANVLLNITGGNINKITPYNLPPQQYNALMLNMTSEGKKLQALKSVKFVSLSCFNQQPGGSHLSMNLYTYGDITSEDVVIDKDYAIRLKYIIEAYTPDVKINFRRGINLSTPEITYYTFEKSINYNGSKGTVKYNIEQKVPFQKNPRPLRVNAGVAAILQVIFETAQYYKQTKTDYNQAMMNLALDEGYLWMAIELTNKLTTSGKIPFELEGAPFIRDVTNYLNDGTTPKSDPYGEKPEEYRILVIRVASELYKDGNADYINFTSPTIWLNIPVDPNTLDHGTQVPIINTKEEVENEIYNAFQDYIKK